MDPLEYHLHTFQMLYSSYRFSWPFIPVMSAVTYNSGILMGDMSPQRVPSPDIVFYFHTRVVISMATSKQTRDS